jgi:hypothetical protein
MVPRKVVGPKRRLSETTYLGTLTILSPHLIVCSYQAGFLSFLCPKGVFKFVYYQGSASQPDDFEVKSDLIFGFVFVPDTVIKLKVISWIYVEFAIGCLQ